MDCFIEPEVKDILSNLKVSRRLLLCGLVRCRDDF